MEILRVLIVFAKNYGKITHVLMYTKLLSITSFFLQIKQAVGYTKVEQIVDFAKNSQTKAADGSLANFYPGVLQKILLTPRCDKALVVSITGVFRSGKSFLLNLMITYLNHLNKYVSWFKYMIGMMFFFPIVIYNMQI